MGIRTGSGNRPRLGLEEPFSDAVRPTSPYSDAEEIAAVTRDEPARGTRTQHHHNTAATEQ